ncbi:hypothetical protein KY362_05885 [Candidatus Woesearchaeota archaeon]|nr:hypothetical protein [Candidatus Woesearchaeota archaeon]
MAETKNILLLTGSNSDINNTVDGREKPSALVERMEDEFAELFDEHPEQRDDYYIAVCSADRTPSLLPAILNMKRFDGIIYSGAYALVLGAALTEALEHLRSNLKIDDYSLDLLMTLSAQHDQRYLPGQMFAPHQRESHYFKAGFIPTIGVPRADTPSGGLSALLAIAENPSGCEPRPTVGLERIDTAVRCMHRMLWGEYDSVTVMYDEHSAPGGDTSSKEGAGKIVQRLESFGVPCQAMPSKPFVIGAGELTITVSTPFYAMTEEAIRLKELDTLAGEQGGMLINCAVKTRLGSPHAGKKTSWEYYLENLDRLNNTISVGIGAYDNAAVLAAQLVGGEEVVERMWEYRNGKTKTGVVRPPTWLVDGKIKI